VRAEGVNDGNGYVFGGKGRHEIRVVTYSAQMLESTFQASPDLCGGAGRDHAGEPSRSLPRSGLRRSAYSIGSSSTRSDASAPRARPRSHSGRSTDDLELCGTASPPPMLMGATASWTIR